MTADAIRVRQTLGVSGEPPGRFAASSKKVSNSIRTTLGSIVTCSGAGVRSKALLDAMRRPEDDLLKGLVGHRTRLRLDAEGVEHVADARADDPVEVFGFGVQVGSVE